MTGVIILSVAAVLLILLLTLKLGIECFYENESFSLKVKVGPVKKTVFPGRAGAGKSKSGKSGGAEKGSEDKKQRKNKRGKALQFRDILDIAKIALETIGRFFRKLSIDELKLLYISRNEDPYKAVMNYGAFNAAMGAFLPLLRRAFKVKKEEINSDVDFSSDEPLVEGSLILTIHFGQLIFVAICAAIAFLKWKRRVRRAEKKAPDENENIENNNAKG